jgi:hypothetical protein
MQLGDEHERKGDPRNTEAEHVDDVRGEQQAHRGNGRAARSLGRPGVAEVLSRAAAGGSGQDTGTDPDAMGERAQAEAGVAHGPARGQGGIALAACGDSGDEGGVRRRDGLASEPSPLVRDQVLDLISGASPPRASGAFTGQAVPAYRKGGEKA